jgi:hypothetical protein
MAHTFNTSSITLSLPSNISSMMTMRRFGQSEKTGDGRREHLQKQDDDTCSLYNSFSSSFGDFVLVSEETCEGDLPDYVDTVVPLNDEYSDDIQEGRRRTHKRRRVLHHDTTSNVFKRELLMDSCTKKMQKEASSSYTGDDDINENGYRDCERLLLDQYMAFKERRTTPQHCFLACDVDEKKRRLPPSI